MWIVDRYWPYEGEEQVFKGTLPEVIEWLGKQNWAIKYDLTIYPEDKMFNGQEFERLYKEGKIHD